MEDESLLQACMRTIVQQTFYQAYWKAFTIVEADSDELREQAFRLRYQVYMTDGRFEAQGAPDPEMMERDAFDDRAAHFLLIHNATGQPAGTARVLTPRVSDPLKSFEMQDLVRHPFLENEERVQHVCEISRLCMAWQFRRRPGDGRILPAYTEQEWNTDVMTLGRPFALMRRRITYAPLGLMMAAFENIMDKGVLECVTLVDPADFRSFKRLGLPYKTLGPRVGFMPGRDFSLQPVIFNIRAALDGVEAVNPECWEVLSDKGRLSRRAGEIQMNGWHGAVMAESARPPRGIFGFL